MLSVEGLWMSSKKIVLLVFSVTNDRRLSSFISEKGTFEYCGELTLTSLQSGITWLGSFPGSCVFIAQSFKDSVKPTHT